MQGEEGALKIAGRLNKQDAWGVRLGVGSFLVIEFGKPEDTPSGRFTRGKFHLWLYMCSWRIETVNNILTSSDDNRSVIETALKGLITGIVESVGLVGPSLDLTIHFASGARLVTISSSSSRDEQQWTLSTPEDNCLTMYGDGSYEYTPRSEPPPRDGSS